MRLCHRPSPLLLLILLRLLLLLLLCLPQLNPPHPHVPQLEPRGGSNPPRSATICVSRAGANIPHLTSSRHNLHPTEVGRVDNRVKQRFELLLISALFPSLHSLSSFTFDHLTPTRDFPTPQKKFNFDGVGGWVSVKSETFFIIICPFPLILFPRSPSRVNPGWFFYDQPPPWLGLLLLWQSSKAV